MANLAKASLGAEDDKTTATSISTVLSDVLKFFNATITRSELRMHQDQVPGSLWEDELGRLRVWAANIGAHQVGLSSLDYRLRDASHIKAQIVRLLEGLARKFRHLEEVLDEDPDELDKLDEEADLDHGGVTEVQQIYKALTENINLLFRMSMLIRRPAHHDRLLGTRREDAVNFEPYDRQHVVEKFPRTNTEIANRLGAAISRRRAYLRYRDRHHAKLGKGITEIEDDKTELSETIATEFKEPNFNLDRMETESSYSQTSYAPTLLEGRSTMTVPSPPKGSANGQPFECPYCFFITTVKDSRSWARHVFKDIMPYVCIFTDCTIPNQLYDSRRDWYRHLVNDHHGWVKDDAQAECPLCQEINLPAPKLERHLGRHLEELALFALPRTDADEDLDSNESSRHSSRASETPAESHPSPHDSTHHATRAEYLTSDSLPSKPGHSSSAHQASIPSTYGYTDEEAPDILFRRDRRLAALQALQQEVDLHKKNTGERKRHSSAHIRCRRLSVATVMCCSNDKCTRTIKPKRDRFYRKWYSLTAIVSFLLLYLRTDEPCQTVVNATMMITTTANDVVLSAEIRIILR